MGVELFTLGIGQSNEDPTGLISEYMILVPEMNFAALTIPIPPPTPTYGLANDTIRFLTFFNPEQTAALPGGPAPAPFAAYTYEYYAKWLEWTSLENDIAGAGRVNPHPAGFRYPNHFSQPRGPIYDSGVPQLVSAYPALISSDVDFARRAGGHFKRRINVAKVAIPSSRLAFTEVDITAPGVIYKWGWFDPKIHNNWSSQDPTGLIERLRKTLISARVAAAAEGNTLQCLVVRIKLSESDAISANARELFDKNAPAFVDKVREMIYAEGLAEASAAQIPVVWAGLPPTPWGATNVPVINTVLQQMQRDDPYFETYDTSDAKRFPKKPGDDAHYTAFGCISLAQEDMAALLRIRQRTTISMPTLNVPTLAQLRDAVLRKVERNTVDSGMDTAVIDEAINESYGEIRRKTGDTAWWLRQIIPHMVNASPFTPQMLPRTVNRLLEIRPVSCPSESIDFSMVGHQDNGRVQIITHEFVNTACWLHAMYDPPKLIAPGEKPVLPEDYVECLKVGAARRVADSSKNGALYTRLLADEKKLLDGVMAHAQKVDRQRRERLTAGRRRYFRTSAVDPWGTGYPWIG